jgi:very-short-patch-repair endonuclease
VDGILLGTSYTWSGARAQGVTRSQIRSDGIPLARGLYLSSSAEPDLRSRCRAWATVLPADAAFALGTAAALFGAAGESADVHVALRPRRVLPQHAGITVHGRTLADEDVVERDGVRVTSGAQTFLDMAAVLPPWDLVALGDALMRVGAMTADDVARRLVRADRVRGVVRARTWAPHLTAKAASHQESVLRYWLLASDLPDPEVQLPVHDRWGREVVHADLGYAEWKVALEYEGRQHAERDQFGRDVDRYSLMAADGWLVLRFAARHVGGPGVPVDRTRRALLNRGWRPGQS